MHSNNQLVSMWSTKKSIYNIECKLCLEKLNIESMGFASLKQYSEAEK